MATCWWRATRWRKGATTPETPQPGATTRDARGRQAEAAARIALEREGWTVLAQRLRTPAGELDLVAERGGLAAFIEVKCRPTLAGAAAALGARQQARLLAAAEAALAANPDWGRAGCRFDVLLVDHAGQVRRIVDAFRQT